MLGQFQPLVRLDPLKLQDRQEESPAHPLEREILIGGKVTEHYQKELDRCRDELGRTPPTDYERAEQANLRRYKAVLMRNSEHIAEFKPSNRSPSLPKWMAFLALALITVFVFLVLQGCGTLIRQTGEMCDYVTNKGVLISRPCASRK